MRLKKIINIDNTQIILIDWASTLDLPLTSRANPVRWRSTHNKTTSECVLSRTNHGLVNMPSLISVRQGQDNVHKRTMPLKRHAPYSQNVQQTPCNKCVHKEPHTATHCNTLQHAAIHCNTLQHTANTL